MKKFLSIIIYTTGLLYLFSAFTKVYPINYFEYIIKETANFDYITTQIISRVIITIELCLGLFYITKFNLKKFTIPISIILLIFFNFILIYQIAFIQVNNCGCFGNKFDLSPENSLIKNFILIILNLFVLWKYNEEYFYTYKSLIIFFIIGAIIFLLFPLKLKKIDVNNKIQKINIIMQTNVKIFSDTLQKSSSKIKIIKKEISIFTPLNKYHKNINVNDGNKILLFLSLDCEHCLQVAKDISKYLNNSNSIVYFLGDEQEIPNFLQKSKIKTNYILLSASEFFEYIDGIPPIIFFLKDGKILKKFTQEEIEDGKLNSFIINNLR